MGGQYPGSGFLLPVPMLVVHATLMRVLDISYTRVLGATLMRVLDVTLIRISGFMSLLFWITQLISYYP